MSKNCSELHKIVNNIKRLNFPFNINCIPENGVYILFEKNEYGHCGDRIVRVGSHTGEKQLRSRLKQHFINENKDRSIFRKNIGRALLNRVNDDYIKLWELDLTTRANKDKYLNIIDIEYQRKIENEVTKYIQEMFSFAVIEENNREKRLWLEKVLISEVSNCIECKSSNNWLGKYSTKENIINSGLWQVNELYKKGFTEEEFIEFSKYSVILGDIKA